MKRRSRSKGCISWSVGQPTAVYTAEGSTGVGAVLRVLILAVKVGIKND